tara:strand:+ start:329 stop:595 length:267 start_codon:yes stop_codon:yes gene_type:complete
MKTELTQHIQAASYGHPKVYPNSENITPPMKKERIRIVEAATRTEIKLNQIKEIEERAKEIQALREQAKSRYSAVMPYTEGEYVDIEV